MLPISPTVLAAAVLLLVGCDHAPKPPDPTATPSPAVEVNNLAFGDGFYKDETNEGVTFRWVRQNASLRVTVPAAGRYDLTFRPITVFSSRENTIDISVNGEKIGHASASACDFAHPQPTTLSANLKAGANEVILQSDTAETRFDKGDDRTPSFGLVLPISLTKLP